MKYFDSRKGNFIVYNEKTNLPIFVSEMAYDYLKNRQCSSHDDAIEEILKNYEETAVNELLQEISVLERESLLDDKHEPKIHKTYPVNPNEFTSYTIMITNNCNLHCRYCYGGSEFNLHNPEYSMNSTIVEDVMNYIFSNQNEKRNVHLMFFGGEPLLNFKAMKAAVELAEKKAVEKKVSVSFGVTTNATIASNEVIEFLKLHKFAITVSFDGPPELQRKCRIRNPNYLSESDYLEHEGNIKKFVKAFDGQLMARVTLTRYSIPYCKEIVEYVKKMGFSSIATSWASSNSVQYPGYPKMEDYEYTESDMEGIIRFEEKLAEYAERSIKGEYPVRVLSLNNLITLFLRRNSSPFACSAGGGAITIDSDGALYPCYRFICSGDQYRFGDIYSGIDPEKQRHYLDKTHLSDLGLCSSCWLKMACKGSCPATVCRASDEKIENLCESIFCEILRIRSQHSLEILSRLTEEEINRCFNVLPEEEVACI